MQRIIPHIWFETQAREAATWYVGIFKDSRILSDTTLHDSPARTVYALVLQLMGQEFKFLNAGPLVDRNPSFSYIVSCSSVEEVDALWNRLAPGGAPLMPLDVYPFSQRYGWLQDRFGVSWQLMQSPGVKIQELTPFLLFTQKACGRAEEAIQFYIRVFGDGEILPGQLERYKAGEGPDLEGTLKHARFRLGDQQFVAMDSAASHAFTFNEMQSLVLHVDTQEEIERYSEALSAVPQAEQCGWVKDKFGVSWQIVPRCLFEFLSRGTPEQIKRVTQAFLPMKRLHIATLEKAFAGG